MHQLKLETERERLAISELIRRTILHFLEAKTRSVNWNSDSLAKAIGKIKLAVTDASVNHDYYLYER